MRALQAKMRFLDDNSPLDYNGYHVNYILQYGWNGYGILNLFTLVIMPTLMKSFHWKNGMVKMDKMEYGPLN